eukprot:scpid7668/ scgid3967/ Ankyrin repeat and BTB/POZ domain-containing protein 2
MSSHHRSTRWTGVAGSGRSSTSSLLTSDPSGNKPGATGPGSSRGAPSASNYRPAAAKLYVSSSASSSPRTQQRYQQQIANSVASSGPPTHLHFHNQQQQNVQTVVTVHGSSSSSAHRVSTSAPGSTVASRAGTLNSSSANSNYSASGADGQVVGEVSSRGGNRTQDFTQSSARGDLSSTTADGPGLDGYRNDQLVAFPAAIGDEIEFRGGSASAGHRSTSRASSSAATPDLRGARDDQRHQHQEGAADSASPELTESGQESPLRRGPSSAALASRRLADALENDEVGALYNTYRDEWSPEPINTAVDPSKPMQQKHRPASAASVLPLSEAHRGTTSNVTYFSDEQEPSSAPEAAPVGGQPHGSQLPGISESGSVVDLDAPPPRPPPPSESAISSPASVAAGGPSSTVSAVNNNSTVSSSVSISTAASGNSSNTTTTSSSTNNNSSSGNGSSTVFSSTTIPIASGGENIKTSGASRQFQGPTSRNRRPLLSTDSGVLQELGETHGNTATTTTAAVMNGSVATGTGHAAMVTPPQSVAKTESAYSESFVGNRVPVNGLKHISRSTQPSSITAASTVISVNTGLEQRLMDRSASNTPLSQTRNFTTFTGGSGASTVGYASNGLAPTAASNTTAVANGDGPSPTVSMARSYGSRQAIAAMRQSGSSTPRYIASGERTSPPEDMYYENTDEYPSEANGGTMQSGGNATSAVAANNSTAAAGPVPGTTHPGPLDKQISETGTQGSNNSDLPPPPSAASQDNLLADASAMTNDPMSQHRHEGSVGEAGSVTLDVLPRGASPLNQGPGGTTPQPARGMTPPMTHTRHESAPVGGRPQASTPTGGSAVHHRVSSQPSSAAMHHGITPTRSTTSTGGGGGGVPRSPWQRKHLYRLCQSSGSQSPLLHSIPPRSLDRLGLFLNRFLYRVMCQARSLSNSIQYCSHHEVLTAIMLVAPASIAEGCIAAAIKARLAYTVSANTARSRTSKSHRCDLVLPVSRIHQWLHIMQVAAVISDCAAVYLTAATEHLGQQIIGRVIAESGRSPTAGLRGSIAEESRESTPVSLSSASTADSRVPLRDALQATQVLSVDTLDYAVSCSPEIWSIVQQHPFLVTPKAVPISNSPSSMSQLGHALGEVRHPWESSMQSLSLSSSDRDSWKANQHPRAPSAASNTTDSTTSSAVGSPGHQSGRASATRLNSLQSSGDLFRFPSASVAAVESKDKLWDLIEQTYVELKSPGGQGMSPYIHSPLPRRRSMQPSGASSVILPSQPSFMQGKLPAWSRAGVDALFHFVSSRRFTGAAYDQQMLLFSSYVKASKTLPSVVDWIRLSAMYAQYRCCPLVDKEDVMLAAELLLPGIVTPSFALRPFAGWHHVPVDEQGADHAELALCRLKTDELFVSIRDAPMESVPHLLKLYSDNVMVRNSQGLTLLMVACMDGNEAQAEYLAIHKPDQLNVSVPRPSRTSPAAMPTLRGWTALHFAVAKRQVNIVKCLLSAGADVEGCVQEMYLSQDVGAAATHSPLQLACAAGYVSIVDLLLDFKADPFLAPPQQRMQHDTTSAFLSCAFAMAAIHGQQDTMTALLSRPIHSTAQDKISLADVLAEADGAQSGEDSLRQLRSRAMQESLFLAAEHGHIDLTLQLRQYGIPWTLHSWGEAVDAAYHNPVRGQQLQQLLMDFNTVMDTEMSSSFCNDTLPLLFSLLRQNVEMCHQVAVVLQTCYGPRSIPTMAVVQPMPSGTSQLDVSWVNNAEMADIIFITEGRQFFAHRIMLLKASSRFQALLSASPVNQAGAMTINLPANIPFTVLEITIRYIYTGGVSLDIPKHVVVQDLLNAARFFELWRLHQHCEVLAGNTLGPDNVCELYTFTKTHDAPILKEACEGFFLAHLTQVCRKPPFRKLLAENGKEFIEMLRSQVVGRLRQRGRNQQQMAFITAC